MASNLVTTEFHEVKSLIRGETVMVSALLPPGFDRNGPSLPLLIHLHGGGATVRGSPLRWYRCIHACSNKARCHPS
jgi:dipeptidyl aminopeptidase/acylaminoacyl peptidase